MIILAQVQISDNTIIPSEIWLIIEGGEIKDHYYLLCTNIPDWVDLKGINTLSL